MNQSNDSILSIKDFISSCSATSESLHKLLPVRLNDHTVLALVDSGNSFYNVLSSSVAKRINLRDYKPYTGSPVGTAAIGSSMDIVGVVPSIVFYLRDETGKEHAMSSRLVIIRDGIFVQTQFICTFCHFWVYLHNLRFICIIWYFLHNLIKFLQKL